jgi:hypothetical protein
MSRVLPHQASDDLSSGKGLTWQRAKSEFLEFANGCKYFSIDGSSHCGRVAQLGEHLLCKQGVAGSNPVTSTKFPLSMNGLEAVTDYWQLLLFRAVPNFVPTPESSHRVEHGVFAWMNIPGANSY